MSSAIPPGERITREDEIWQILADGEVLIRATRRMIACGFQRMAISVPN